jgi:hypothetical protein
MYETEYEAELEEELEDELEGELEDEAEYEDEDESEYEDELEDEDESEYEDEDEYEVSPVRKVYPDAVMEHLGALAAEAETEEEAAEHFLPLIGMAASKLLPLAAKAIAPMAKRALPRIVKAVTHVTPQLTRGVGKIARALHRQPAGRRLLRAVPVIARRTVHSIARQAAHKRPITPRMAVRTLARQARRVLKSPGARTKALRRHYRMDRRFHRRLGHGIVGPHATRPSARYPGMVARRRLGTGTGVVRRSRAGYGRSVGGRCVCGATPGAAPSFCGCCGQPLR